MNEITPKPNIIMLQEHKMKQVLELCEKISALDIRRGKAFWNGATLIRTPTNIRAAQG